MLPIYYINVAARTDRREHMEQLFGKLSLRATRFEALLPTDLPEELVERYCREDSPIKHGASHLACSLSHYEVWRSFLETGAAAALIFEDDALLSPELPQFLAQLGDGLPDGVDILKIETFGNTVRLSSRSKKIGYKYNISRLFGNHFGACGYIISHAAAERLLDDPRHLDFLIDEYIFSRRSTVIFKHQIYQLNPALSIQMSIYQKDNPSGPASSDLQFERASGAQPVAARGRWLRLRELAPPAVRDLRYFAYDLKGLLGQRCPVPFAGDK